jgi:hypothetical protein
LEVIFGGFAAAKDSSLDIKRPVETTAVFVINFLLFCPDIDSKKWKVMLSR